MKQGADLMINLEQEDGRDEEGVSHHSDEVGVAPINDEAARGLLIRREQGKQC